MLSPAPPTSTGLAKISAVTNNNVNLSRPKVADGGRNVEVAITLSVHVATMFDFCVEWKQENL